MVSNPSAAEDRRALWPIAAFTLIYLAAAVAGALSSGNSEFVFYIVVMLVLIALVVLIHWQVRFSIGLLWCLSIWGLSHMAGGLVPVPESWPINGEIHVLYSWWLVPERLKYDQVVHAYGFGVTTWACWQALQVAIASRTGQVKTDIRPAVGLLVLCVAAGMGFGAMNEVIEFAATLLVPETNVGGYLNTGWDLVSNLVGCVTASLSIWLLAPRS